MKASNLTVALLLLSSAASCCAKCVTEWRATDFVGPFSYNFDTQKLDTLNVGLMCSFVQEIPCPSFPHPTLSAHRFRREGLQSGTASCKKHLGWLAYMKVAFAKTLLFVDCHIVYGYRNG